jgi:hypothetical protein
MEITCKRCHQAVLAENCYCPVCGLPQLLYATDDTPGQTSPERWNEAVRDAATIDWKPALRAALIVAIPAGVLVSPLGFFGLFWMAAAATWAVALYLRSHRPAGITIGVGARIGLVTGLLGGWTAAASSAVTLFALRFFFQQGGAIDDFWRTQVSEKIGLQWQTANLDAQSAANLQSTLKLLNSSEGRAGITFCVILLLALALVVFATAGGALGAQLMGRRRQPEA